MDYYKIVRRGDDGRLWPAHGGTGEWVPDVDRVVSGDLTACRNAIHFCAVDELVYWASVGTEVWEFSPVVGKAHADENKHYAAGGRITRCVGRVTDATFHPIQAFYNAAVCQARDARNVAARRVHDAAVCQARDARNVAARSQDEKASDANIRRAWETCDDATRQCQKDYEAAVRRAGEEYGLALVRQLTENEFYKR